MHTARKVNEMTPYTILSSHVGTQEATALSARLSAWHDAMVAHERKLRAGSTSDDVCHDECPHAEASVLWSQALDTFGTRAQQLTFLRTRAERTRRTFSPAVGPEPRFQAADRSRGG